MKRIAALLAVSTLVLGATACGGGGSGRLSKHQYEARMSSIVRELASVPSKLGSFSPTDFKAVDGYFRTLADTFDRLHGQLVSITPPGDVRALHRQLADAAGRAGAALRRLADRLHAATPADRQRILTSYDASTGRLLAAFDGVERAANAIDARGYRFSSSAGT